MLEGIPLPLTEAGYDAFRRKIRNHTVDVAHTITDGEQRMTMLHEMIEVQPDSGSRGHLFTAYAKKDAATQKLLPFEKDTPAAFTGAGLQKTRTPDAAASVATPKKPKPTDLPSGRHAIENKTGPGAFKMEQAEDYAKRAVEGKGFRLKPRDKDIEYQNLVYMFSNETDAVAAYEALRQSTKTKALVDRDPGGFHVMYYDESGDLVRKTDQGV
jgi:hypothetical protein